jgi:hypothetical protein
MTTKTRAQLVELAAEELLLTSDGNSLEDSDEDKIDRRVDGLFAELSARGVVDVDDEAEIPVEWCGPLAELLANECAVAFGKQKISPAARTEIEDRLKVIIQRIDPSSPYLKTDLPKAMGRFTYNRWLTGR